jgi:hypothetical protein
MAILRRFSFVSVTVFASICYEHKPKTADRQANSPEIIGNGIKKHPPVALRGPLVARRRLRNPVSAMLLSAMLVNGMLVSSIDGRRIAG